MTKIMLNFSYVPKKCTIMFTTFGLDILSFQTVMVSIDLYTEMKMS